MKSKANRVREGWGESGDPQPLEGERSEPEGGGGSPGLKALEPEVVPGPQRRRFSPEYKLRVLREADACRHAGEVGALLRREGLYSSHLASWRRAREKGALSGLAPRRRGRKPDPNAARDRQIAKLEKENARLKDQLRKAEKIIEVQKKLSEVLGLETKGLDSSERDG